MAAPDPITPTKDIAALTAEAELALSNQEWQAAARAYRELIARQPRNADHRFKLMQAYDELGRVDDVLELLKDPALAGLDKTKRRLARVYIDLKDYAAAIPLIDELIAAHPENSKFAKWRAVCVEKGGGDAEAAERIQSGLKLLESGELEEAEQLYAELLEAYPDIARAWLHLGQIYALQKRWDEAVAPLRRGLELDPDNRKLKNTFARVLFKLEEPGAAISLLNSGSGPEDDVDSLFLLQRCHVELQDWPVASALGERLLALLPAGDPLRERVEELRAEAAVRKDLAAAAAMGKGADPGAAVAAYRDVAARHPRSPMAWIALGSALSDAGRNEESIEALGQGVAATGDDLDVRTALTAAIIKSDDEERILRHVLKATADGEGDFEAFRWLARHHAGREEWEPSLEKAERALTFDAQSGSAKILLVQALLHLDRMPEALDELNALLATGRKRFEALQLKGDVLVRLSRVEAAIAVYKEAAILSPKDPVLSSKLGAALLLSGDVEGFHLSYNRAVRPVEEEARRFEEWSGELSIPGKLLVSSDAAEGIGQKILYLRFLKQLLGLGFDVVLEIDEDLVALCRRSFPQVTVVPSGSTLPETISHHVPLTGLFRWFKPDLDSLASEQPYLAPDVQAVAAHRARLNAAAGEGRLLVGTSWRSSDPDQAGLATHADRLLAGVAAQVTTIDLDDQDRAADELSALVAAMDLVLCADGPVAHLAGAMGMPNVTVLPAAPEAHWLAAGESCAWYPSTQLRRQAAIDEGWTPVLEQVGAAVQEFVRGYDTGQWLSGSLVASGEPFAGQAKPLPDREIADAVRAFVAQGAYRYTAYRSALELIDRISHDGLSRALKIQKAELLLRFGEWSEARALLLSMKVEGERDEDVERLILSASLGMYDLDSALPIARGLAGQEPRHHLTAANVLYRMGRVEEALSELRSASLEAAELDGLSSLLGTLLLGTGQVERCETYLVAQAAATRSAADYTLLGRALSARGKPEDALAAFDKAIAVSPDDPAANFWRTLERISSGDVNRTPLPPIEGQTPQVSPDDLVLFFVADSGYFWEHALVLLGSIGRRSPSAKCHVHVVNPDPGIAPAIDAIRNMLPDLELSYSYETVELGGRDESFVRTYYASVRFVRLAEIFARSPATYLCIDSDCIVRGDIAAQASALDVPDVGIRLRYHDHPHATVAAGALMLRPTAGAAKFIGRAAELISIVLETGEAAWFLDQIVLSEVVRELGGGEVEASQLDMSYIDWFFHDDSLVWTGKGPRKLTDSRYTRELAQYRYIRENEEIARLMPETGAEALDP